MLTYNFKEAKLDDKFCGDLYRQVSDLIEEATVFTLLGMPGVGVSYFLRFLASKKTHFVKSQNIRFVFVDVYSLATLSRKEYVNWLLRELGSNQKFETEEQAFEECGKQLEKLIRSYSRVVIIFNRFDQMRGELDKQFISQLRTLKYIAQDQISMIFTGNKPLYETAAESIVGNNIHFFAKTLFFGTFSKEDIEKLFKLKHQIKINDPKIQRLIHLSGGHNQLLDILLKSESQENLILDRFVKLEMQEIYEYLAYHQKKQLQKIALGKSINQVDPYLVNIGIVIVEDDKYCLFTPLLAEYIKAHVSIKIPAKEGKLFKFLKTRLGQVVSKDEIFDHIWGDNPDLASDWALNALIYRLRKNPGFKAGNYVIESYKKLGYSLLKEA